MSEEAISKALAAYDAAVATCPYKSARPPSSDKPCRICTGTASDGCWNDHNAAHQFVADVRAALTPTLSEREGEKP